MNKISSVVLIIFIIFFSGCKSNRAKLNLEKDNNTNEIEKKSVNNENNKNEEFILKFGKKRIDIKFNFNKVNGKIDRVFKKINIVPKFKLGGITDTIFKLPINVKTDDKQNIYVLDQMDKSVTEFNRSGEFIKRYGRFGKGPGEFLFSQGFDVFNDGKIVVADPNNNKITVFEGKKIYEYKCRLRPLKASFISTNEVIIFQMLEPVFTSMLRKINYKKKTIVDYENILNRDSFKNKVYGLLPFVTGDIHRYRNNNIVYTSRVMNFVVVFNAIGEIIKAFKMIDDDLDLSSVSIEKFPKKLTYSQTCVYKDELFVFKKLNKKGITKYVVDIFSLSKGKYKYSFEIKGIAGIQSVQFADNRMFLIKETTEIIVYLYKIY